MSGANPPRHQALNMANDPPIELPAALKRRLGLPLLVLYGVGITIGAGRWLRP
jgi:hypothetical protein